MSAYYEICAQYDSYDWDEYTLAPWSYQGDQWVAYDNAQSIRQKVVITIDLHNLHINNCPP